MGFLNEITLPKTTNATAAPVGNSSFLNNVTLPSVVPNPKGDGFPALQNGVEMQPTEQPKNYFQTATQGVKDYIKSNSYPTETSKNLTDFTKKAGQPVEQSLGDYFDKVSNAIDTWHSNATNVEKGTAIGEAGVGLMNTLFSSVTGTLKAAETVPLVRPFAYAVNSIFGAVGSASSAVAGKAVDGSSLSDKTKTTIKPLVQELSALASQIALGKGADISFGKAKTLTQTIVSHIKDDVAPTGSFLDSVQLPKNIPVSSTGDVNRIKVNTPNTRHAEYAASQGYEPYTPEIQLPIIEAGKVKSDLPVIQIEAKTPNKLGSFTYEPIKETPVENQKTSQVNLLGKVSPVEVPKTVKQTSQPIDISGQKSSGVGVSIASKALENEFTKSFGSTAGYDPITIKDQAERASNVMKNMDMATKMVKGEIPMESGLKGEMLIKAMEDHAQKTGDVNLLRDIANSPLVSETSAHAQAMRILAERNPDSVVAKLQEIKKTRESAVEKRTGKKATKAISDTVKEIKKGIAKPTKQNWSEFVDSIKCNY